MSATARKTYDDAAKRKTNGHDPEAVPPIIDVDEWLTRPLPPPDFLLGELLSTTGRVGLAADTGLGKSMLGMGLAFAMAKAAPFLGWTPPRPSRWLVLDGEMPADLLQDRIRTAAGWFGHQPGQARPSILSHEDVAEMPPLDTEDGFRWLMELIDRRGPFDGLIFDNIMSLASGDLREETTWRDLLPVAMELSRRKMAQFWLHHVGADKSRPYGGRFFWWRFDVLLMGEKVESAGADVSMRLRFEKARRRSPANREDFTDRIVELRDGQWSHHPDDGTELGPASARKPENAVAFKALQKALHATGFKPPHHEQTAGVDRAVTLKQWRAYLDMVSPPEALPEDSKGRQREMDRRRKEFTRARDALVASGLVGSWGSEAFWIAKGRHS